MSKYEAMAKDAFMPGKQAAVFGCVCVSEYWFLSLDTHIQL